MHLPAPQRRRRTVPVWSVVLVVALVAVAAAGVGGAVGAQVGLSNGESAAAGGPSLNDPPPTGAPSRAPDTIAGVAQRVSPSVVSIQASGPGLSGNGSGFVIEGDHVVTNNHVSSALERGGIEVVYSDGHTSGADVVGSAPSADLAVLKLKDPIDVEALEFGDSDQVTVGDEVIAIGAPLGLAGTVTTGIISAVDRPVTVGEEGQETFINALQTDAAINPGNSGGPLVDAQGRVIGVNSAIATMGAMPGEQSGSIGLGFAIPSSQTERVVNELIENGDIRQAVIGAVLDMRFGQDGAPIVSDEQAGGDAVVPDGPADKAGLKAGDLIVEFDGRKVSDSTELRLLLSQKQPGDKVEVAYERDGEKRTTTITLGEAKD
ncbi:putative serine protease PepD [Nocardiopsis mwathae]|uniref:Putative serine protease PepD n=1 Tax=Nocardiopsis mwathae TaxID=1472723 RepID=A0A7X0D6G3_9ACTN|nr:trypsin-like peptidase domain-containing protein [Nocardiopsis mwathae]MBB6173283.1 putative serine protease PepD [Nocardiopsis mwathae]